MAASTLMTLAYSLYVGSGLTTYIPAFTEFPGVVVAPDKVPGARVLLATVTGRVMGEVRQSWEQIEDIPDELVLLILGVAARSWANPKAVVQESSGPYSATYVRPAVGIVFTSEEKAVLKRYGASSGLKIISTVRGDLGVGPAEATIKVMEE